MSPTKTEIHDPLGSGFVARGEAKTVKYGECITLENLLFHIIQAMYQNY